MKLMNIVFALLGSIFTFIGLAFVIMGLSFGVELFFICFGGIFLLIGILFASIGFIGLAKYRNLIKTGKRVTGTVVQHNYNTSMYINGRPVIDLIVEQDGAPGIYLCANTNTNKRYKFPIGMKVTVIVGEDDFCVVDMKATQKYIN